MSFGSCSFFFNERPGTSDSNNESVFSDDNNFGAVVFEVETLSFVLGPVSNERRFPAGALSG